MNTESRLSPRFKVAGIVIPYVDYGFGNNEGPQIGETMVHTGLIRERKGDADDEFLCFRFGEDASLDEFYVSMSDCCYFEAFQEIKEGSDDWIAWLMWCRQKFKEKSH